MARGLAEAQQRFEDLDLRLAEALLVDQAEQAGAVMVAQLVVELPLVAFQFAVDRLLLPRRQIGRYLLLGPAKDERTQAAGEHLARLDIRRFPVGRAGREERRAAQQSRIEKL